MPVIVNAEGRTTLFPFQHFLVKFAVADRFFRKIVDIAFLVRSIQQMGIFRLIADRGILRQIPVIPVSPEAQMRFRELFQDAVSDAFAIAVKQGGDRKSAVVSTHFPAGGTLTERTGIIFADEVDNRFRCFPQQTDIIIRHPLLHFGVCKTTVDASFRGPFPVFKCKVFRMFLQQRSRNDPSHSFMPAGSGECAAFPAVPLFLFLCETGHLPEPRVDIHTVACHPVIGGDEVRGSSADTEFPVTERGFLKKFPVRDRDVFPDRVMFAQSAGEEPSYAEMFFNECICSEQCGARAVARNQNPVVCNLKCEGVIFCLRQLFFQFRIQSGKFLRRSDSDDLAVFLYRRAGNFPERIQQLSLCQLFRRVFSGFQRYCCLTVFHQFEIRM